MTSELSSWDSSAMVVVPGLPGQLSRPDNEPAYPASTLVFVKLLRGAGYPIRVATPESIREISHHAADEWLPVVNFGLQVLAGGAGNILAGILMLFFDSSSRRSAITHISWNIQGPDGTVHNFEFDGDARSAIEAARTFERSLGYGNRAD